MPGRKQGIIMHYIAQGVNQIVQNQIQPQELIGLCGNILGEDGTVLFADLVS
jgi:hypothetical protein